MVAFSADIMGLSGMEVVKVLLRFLKIFRRGRIDPAVQTVITFPRNEEGK